MPSLQEKIGQQVRRARTRLSLTQSQLGERVGLGDETVRAIESGRRGVSVQTLLSLAKALHVGAGVLLGEAEPLAGKAEAEAARIVGDLPQPWRAFAVKMLRELHESAAKTQK